MTKIFPMPKIEFSKAMEGIADFDNRRFVKDFEALDCIEIYVDGSHVGSFVIKENQTFEQAVTEYVKNWVINNFNGIVLPDLDDKYNDNYKDGYNECMANLLELNPNCIRED